MITIADATDTRTVEQLTQTVADRNDTVARQAEPIVPLEGQRGFAHLREERVSVIAIYLGGGQ